jgi:hypothetical protein
MSDQFLSAEQKSAPRRKRLPIPSAAISIAKFIVDFSEKRGGYPSTREIANEFKMKPADVLRWLEVLEIKGVLIDPEKTPLEELLRDAEEERIDAFRRLRLSAAALRGKDEELKRKDEEVKELTGALNAKPRTQALPLGGIYWSHGEERYSFDATRANAFKVGDGEDLVLQTFLKWGRRLKTGLKGEIQTLSGYQNPSIAIRRLLDREKKMGISESPIDLPKFKGHGVFIKVREAPESERIPRCC